MLWPKGKQVPIESIDYLASFNSLFSTTYLLRKVKHLTFRIPRLLFDKVPPTTYSQLPQVDLFLVYIYIYVYVPTYLLVTF